MEEPDEILPEQELEPHESQEPREEVEHREQEEHLSLDPYLYLPLLSLDRVDHGEVPLWLYLQLGHP